MKKRIILITLCFSFINIFSQKNDSNSLYKTIEGISFSNFPVKTFENIKKTLINFKSNAFAREYKTKISEIYRTTNINFGGHYILVSWPAGMGTSQGIMVDSKTGNVFDIPVNDATTGVGCFSDEAMYKYNLEFGDQQIFFSLSSNLLVTRQCDDNEKNAITYYFFEWNDLSKKFKKIKTISKPLLLDTN